MRLIYLLSVTQASALHLQVTRRLFPELASEINAAGVNCDRLGMSGANAFICEGYIAADILKKTISLGNTITIPSSKANNTNASNYNDSTQTPFPRAYDQVKSF